MRGEELSTYEGEVLWLCLKYGKIYDRDEETPSDFSTDYLRILR